jgi:hypothetical protein
MKFWPTSITKVAETDQHRTYIPRHINTPRTKLLQTLFILFQRQSSIGNPVMSMQTTILNPIISVF